MKALLKIQNEIKAPKNQFNTFGKYKYRSCEDIMEAAKPVLNKYECLLTISDEIIDVGGRIYVKATAVISDGNTQVHTIAYAREAETKKGMDDAQITGSASSYARKYALAGLFLLDDTKDPDATNDENKKEEKKKAWLDKESVMRRLEMCKSEETLMAIWAETKDKTDQDVIDAFSSRKKKIRKEETNA